MDRRLSQVILSLVGVLVALLLVVWIGGAINENLKLDNTALLRFVFVGIGLAIVLLIYRNRGSANIDELDVLKW